jgi:hypothetical protein
MEKELNSPDFPENGIQKESLKKLFDFTLWALTLPEGQYVALKDQNVGKAPRWNTELFDQAVCKKIRTDFMEGHRVAFHVPINVQMESKPTQNSFFRVYMEQDAGVKNAENHFIRAGITIKDVRSLNAKGIRGMVVIEDKPLRTMLGDAENPAHTEWQKDSKKFKSRKYVNGPTSLSFVQNSLREIFQFINKPPEGRDKTLLENIFYIDRPPTEPDGETETVQPETRGGAPETIEVPELPRHKRLFQLKPLQGGFQIRQNPQSEQIPSSVTVRLAYVVRRGNPFKKYHELDFDLSKKPITIASSGIALTECGLNRLAFEVRDRTFEITVRGFDLERDLKIDAKNGPVP